MSYHVAEVETATTCKYHVKDEDGASVAAYATELEAMNDCDGRNETTVVEDQYFVAFISSPQCPDGVERNIRLTPPSRESFQHCEDRIRQELRVLGWKLELLVKCPFPTYVSGIKTITL